MRNWFLSLEERERLFVVAAAIVSGIALLYAAVWLPLEREQKRLESSVDNWKESLAELRILKGTVNGQGQEKTVVRGPDQSLVVIVDNTLRQHGLYNSLQRSQPTAGNGIRVEFENAAFDTLVLWLEDLGSDYGLKVQSGTFSSAAGNRDGRVNATLTLER